MIIQDSVSLKPFNTFGINQTTTQYAEFNSVEELLMLNNKKNLSNCNLLILGGGSNILLTKNFNGLTLRNCIKGKEVISQNENHIWVKAGAGENWHSFVLWCVEKGFAGIENLSLIPGNVGASPMQNIGAYGVEIKDVFESLEAFHLESGEMHVFNNAECKFGYRESVFKNIYKGKYIITSVTYKLNKIPAFNTSYGAIEQELATMNIETLSIKAVSDAVINIRKSKLPNPNEIGNAGSFFKNPVIDNSQYTELKSKFPELPGYKAGENSTKVAAGWLIEQAGWKGKTFDKRYGVHKKQALVLVNYGNTKGKEIYDLSQQIIDSVLNTYGIELEREVNII